MTRKELYNICHDEAVAYANSEQWSKRTGEEKSFLIQGYLDAMMEARKSEITEKKKEYPKKFVDCCTILYPNDNFQVVSQRVKGHKGDLLFHFQKLIICRDAYWKIAGEEMGLGKPWVPDWNNISDKYCIYFVSGDAGSKECQTRQCPFAFPTPEMRDAFKENFDPDIEKCKEFL